MSQNVPKCPLQPHRCPNRLVSSPFSAWKRQIREEKEELNYGWSLLWHNSAPSGRSRKTRRQLPHWRTVALSYRHTSALPNFRTVTYRRPGALPHTRADSMFKLAAPYGVNSWVLRWRIWYIFSRIHIIFHVHRLFFVMFGFLKNIRCRQASCSLSRERDIHYWEPNNSSNQVLPVPLSDKDNSWGEEFLMRTN